MMIGMIAFCGTVFFHYFHREGVVVFFCLSACVALYILRKQWLGCLEGVVKSFDKTVQRLDNALDRKARASSFRPNPDNYTSLEDLNCDLRESGLESSNLILAVDFTESNLENGEGGTNLHDISCSTPNPYLQVIDIFWKALRGYDDDGKIPTYMFGDEQTRNRSVQPLDPTVDDARCNGGEGIKEAYLKRLTEGPCKMSGPTNFAPAIRKAIEIVKEEQSHHILVIITDGAVVNARDTEEAIIEASHYPLSIVAVGVGTGGKGKNKDFALMEKYDDELPERAFDNFQFVNWTAMIKKYRTVERATIPFTIASLQEVVDQKKDIQELRLL